MIISPDAHQTPVSGVPLAKDHFCPVCLKSVASAHVERRGHKETYTPLDVNVALLHCPICGLVLAAEIAGTAKPFAAI